jgi:transcriptional regulator with XRE-family HTH domain
MKTLQQARKNAGYTQKMMCEELDLDQSSIAHWEGGYREIPPYRLEQMLQMYGVHPDEIELPILKRNRHQRKPQNSNINTTKRADALRFALGQIVPKDHMEKVIEICAMIYEVERK